MRAAGADRLNASAASGGREHEQQQERKQANAVRSSSGLPNKHRLEGGPAAGSSLIGANRRRRGRARRAAGRHVQRVSGGGLHGMA